jgi:hypothetical protein
MARNRNREDQFQQNRKEDLTRQVKEAWAQMALLGDGSSDHQRQLSCLRTRVRLLEEEIAQINGILAQAG